jgi:pimeloyl-[acyl-carrier protein] methyl ester esterase
MRLHSETIGDGSPVVLLHGWAMNLRVFDGLAAALAPTHRVTTIDLPGHGRSPWRAGLTPVAIADWLLEELPERGTLLGWSLGGQLALRIAARTPARVSRLVLVASTPKFVAGSDWPHGLEPEVLQRFAAGLQSDYTRTVGDFLELQVRGSSAATATLQQLRTALERQGAAMPAALASGLAQLAGEDLRELARTLTLPVLVVSGQCDRVTPPDAARALAALLPDARLLELRRAGHAPFLSHLDTLLPELQSFLQPRDAEGVAA